LRTMNLRARHVRLTYLRARNVLVTHISSMLVMVRYVRVMYAVVWNVRDMHVWEEMSGESIIYQGTNAHTKNPPEISKLDLIHARNIHLSTYYNNKDYLVLPKVIVSSLSGESSQKFFSKNQKVLS
jgi:hypothetical protein